MQINRLVTQAQFVLRYSLLLTFIFTVIAGGAYFHFRIQHDLKTAIVAWRTQPKQQRQPGNIDINIGALVPLEPIQQTVLPHLHALAWILAGSTTAAFGLVSLTRFLQPSDAIHRGTQIFTAQQLLRWLSRQPVLRRPAPGLPKNLRSRFFIGSIPFPVHWENLSLLGFGSPGSGKSVFLNQIVRGIAIWGRLPFSWRSALFGKLLPTTVLALAAVGSAGLALVSYFNLEGPRSGIPWQVIAGLTPAFAALSACSTLRRRSLPGIADQGGFLYDRADLTEYHFREGVDYLLDPFDARSVHINLFNELTDDARLTAFCAGFYPAAEGSDSAFWNGLASSLLEASMKLCIARARLAGARPSMPMYAEILRTFAADLDTFRAELSRFPDTYASVSNLLGDPGSEVSRAAQSAFITFTKDARVFLHPAWLQEQRPNFSLRRFLSILGTADHPLPKPFLFIRNRAQHQAVYKKIYSALLNLVFTEILSNPAPQPWPRVQILIDEWASLQPLNMLAPLLAEGRKYGLLVCAFAQSPKQIETLYGAEGAATLFTGFGTQLIFRQNDAVGAEQLSRVAGDREQNVETSGTQMNEHQLWGSVSQSQSRQVRRALLQSEIMALTDLHFYARLPNAPWFKGQVPKKFFKKRPNLQPFVEASLPDEIFNPLGAP